MAEGLIARLTSQLAAKGHPAPREAALELLRARGHVDVQGNLTPAGQAREALGRAGRALDRKSRETGKPASEYIYDPVANRAKRR